MTWRRIIAGLVIFIGCVAAYLFVHVFVMPRSLAIVPAPTTETAVINFDGMTSIPLFGDAQAPSDTSPQARRRRDVITVNARMPVIVASNTVRFVRDNSSVGAKAEPALVISGDKDGKTGWEIDGFLLLETFVGERPYSRAVVGDVKWLETIDGTLITRLGRKTKTFSANEVNIVSLVPGNGEFHLRMQVLSFNKEATVSPIFLVKEQ